MTAVRLDDHPGLTAGAGWHEVAFSTGNATWPVARVRVTPIVAMQEAGLHRPNGPVMPPRVEVAVQASLVDEAGQVLRINGRLLVGPETRHSRQFDVVGEFNPLAWLDGAAGSVIEALLRWADGMASAAAGGLLPALPEPELR